MDSSTKSKTDQREADKSAVLALIAERGSVPRSDLWQTLHGRVTESHVDQSLKALLREGLILATKANLSKSVVGRSNCRLVIPYTATVYSAVQGDG